LGELVSIRLIREEHATYGWVERLGGHGSDTNSFAVLHDDFVNFGVALEVQVRVDGPGGMNVRMG
jgi:hypothetical protein